MREFNAISFDSSEILKLKESLLQKPFVFRILEDIELSTRLVSHGISREIGTANDELARFIFDAPSGQLIEKNTLRAEIIEYQDRVGVRIYSIASRHLEVRIRGFRALCHPTFSENADGTFRQLVIFPEVIARIAALQNIALVVTRPWALNSVFGGFNLSEEFYATNLWELTNNDSALFADLVANRSLAFIGTHDLVAHVAGLDGAPWPKLQENALKVRSAIRSYVGDDPSPADLVLPYTAGVILDDLAQPPSYLSTSHQCMLDEVLLAMSRRPTRDPSEERKSAMLLQYPTSFEKVIRLSRDTTLTREKARATVQTLCEEISATAVCY